jgi:hypothetical protein
MAWETGTATDHVDLLNKIRDFLTTNADLVAGGQNWDQELGPTGVLVHGDQITLRGPGLTGTDNIYCGLQTLEDPGADTYNLQFWGHAGFSATLAQREQPLMSPDAYVLLWNQPMTYWVVGNGRRWMLAVKVSTVYSTAYCGFFLPYGTPSEYPFPMTVAGVALESTRWSTEDQRNRFFASPGYNTFWTYYPDNTWRSVQNYGDNANNYAVKFGFENTSPGYLFPTRSYTNGVFVSPSDEQVTSNANRCFDGSYLMRDLTIISTASGGVYDALMGVLDGAYWVPGRENSSENIISRDGVDHLVVQNLFRNGFRDYMTMRLQ